MPLELTLACSACLLRSPPYVAALVRDGAVDGALAWWRAEGWEVDAEGVARCKACKQEQEAETNA